MEPLPIRQIQDELVRGLTTDNRVVVTAPTGAGKSTQIPQFLADHLDVPERILVLQPRRLAARMLAERVAAERDVTPGAEVGFQTRFERAVSRDTRICFITDGVLLRMLLSNRRLTGIGAVVFDEFHERSLAADTALAVVHDLQQTVRKDLKIVVMSATLQTRSVRMFLQDCPHLHAEGRTFPVHATYLATPSRRPVWETAAGQVRELIAAGHDGDVLVFMPGVYEIRRTCETVSRLKVGEPLRCLPLYGDLPPDRQHQVMNTAPERKIIVATNIAETSLTIPGVRHVVDSGLVRISRYSAGRGFDMLNIEPISRASADQRMGRAGREAPGTCRRMWTLAEQQQKHADTDPEIKRCDLAGTLLLLRALGIDSSSSLRWVDAPSPDALADATDLLACIGAVSAAELTPLGRSLTRLPMHPRLARLLVDADEDGGLKEAAMIAAVLSERPFIQRTRSGTTRRNLDKTVANTLHSNDRDDRAAPRSDLFALIHLLQQAHHSDFRTDACDRLHVNAAAARQVWRAYQYYVDVAERAGFAQQTRPGPSAEALLKSLMLAFPDRLVRRRDRGTLMCELPNGKHAELTRDSTVRDAELLIVCDMRDVSRRGQNNRPVVSLASEVRPEWLRDCFPDEWQDEETVVWDDRLGRAVRRHRVCCLGLTIAETTAPETDPARVAPMLEEQLTAGNLQLRGWNKEVKRWIERVRWVAARFPERKLITYDDDDINVIHHELCEGAIRARDLRDRPCLPVVRNVLSWEDQKFVENMAPDHIRLPCGRRMKLFYIPGQTPKGKARIQEFYDLAETPRVAGGRDPVLLEILAPNMKTVQITDDLAGFWENHYPSVRKELARRYPKHEWR